MLGQQLKLWGDRYCVVLENKGGASTTVKIRNFVVTSQYSMEEIFGGDSKTLEALRRRFQVIHIPFNIHPFGRAAVAAKKDPALSDPFVIDSFAVDSYVVDEPKDEDSEFLALLEDS